MTLNDLKVTHLPQAFSTGIFSYSCAAADSSLRCLPAELFFRTAAEKTATRRQIYRVSDDGHECANKENTKLRQTARGKRATFQLTAVLQRTQNSVYTVLGERLTHCLRIKSGHCKHKSKYNVCEKKKQNQYVRTFIFQSPELASHPPKCV